jgi:hypothetical protein
MTARETLTSELRAEVLRLEDDLRARVTSLSDVQDKWRSEYESARAAERTAAAWEAWVDERVTLAAVAWVLTTVFIRFCEDNALVKPVWLSGPRSREAIEAQQQFLRETARTNADVTDREWLLEAIDYMRSLPATLGLVDETSAMWLITPSGDAAARLLSYWRERDESGALLRDLADPELDTRFLGDLYQEISEHAKQRYALRQTPVFVEEFILDRTMGPALNERPLEGFKMIDPTCGSGHFLLGAFQRLLDRWHAHAPGFDERERVQAALDSVHGVDLNPFAVAIARFRLTVAALLACGIGRLEDAPAFRYHLAVGDSLLHGLQQHEFEFREHLTPDRVAVNFAYETENLDQLRVILQSGKYDAVVGNPPYITVSDRGLNRLYRRLYASCKGPYPLSVPFMERFFALASDRSPAGWVGQITSNSFMKREFGIPLVEKFLPSVDVREVIDSEGAWIPGHNMEGTPTVILIGRCAPPVGQALRAVLSKNKREDRSSAGGEGPYWRQIVAHIDEPGFDSDWLSVVDLERAQLKTHPWSLTGGEAPNLMAAIDAGSHVRLKSVIAGKIGFASFPGADDAFLAPKHTLEWAGVPPPLVRSVVSGKALRDWQFRCIETALVPYLEAALVDLDEDGWGRYLWPLRTTLQNVTGFEGETQLSSGAAWWGWYRWVGARYLTPLSIAYAEIAQDSNFYLDRGGNVFDQTAPMFKLPHGRSLDDHHRLLGVLNSSVATFWMRNQSKPKGGRADFAWARTFQFNATRVEKLPLPDTLPLEPARSIAECAERLRQLEPASVLDSRGPDSEGLAEARSEWLNTHDHMVALQEELDWAIYHAFELLDEEITLPIETVPGIELGQRAFEIVLGRELPRQDTNDQWFGPRRIVPRTELPADWPTAYQAVVTKRIEVLTTNALIALLERPEHKRRWEREAWDTLQKQALAAWLLRRLGQASLWFDAQQRPTPKSIAVLADAIGRDADFVAGVELWLGRPDASLVSAIGSLCASTSVPYLAALRHTSSGLRKRIAWERVWEKQRADDQRGKTSDDIEVPPEYKNSDFLRPSYWSQRGKLDIPSERFVLYPNAGIDGDLTPVVGWAGWNHAQKSLAVATLLDRGAQQGWSDERLLPLVAGLLELLPWVEQWHSEPDALYGGSSPAEFFSELLDGYMVKLGATRESLAQWRPPAPTRGRRARS